MVTAVQAPVRNIPALQLVVQVLQAVLLSATSWKLPALQPTQEPVVVAVHGAFKNWPAPQPMVQPMQAVWAVLGWYEVGEHALHAVCPPTTS